MAKTEAESISVEKKAVLLESELKDARLKLLQQKNEAGKLKYAASNTETADGTFSRMDATAMELRTSLEATKSAIAFEETEHAYALKELKETQLALTQAVEDLESYTDRELKQSKEAEDLRMKSETAREELLRIREASQKVSHECRAKLNALDEVKAKTANQDQLLEGLEKGYVEELARLEAEEIQVLSENEECVRSAAEMEKELLVLQGRVEATQKAVDVASKEKEVLEKEIESVMVLYEDAKRRGDEDLREALRAISERQADAAKEAEERQRKEGEQQERQRQEVDRENKEIEDLREEIDAQTSRLHQVEQELAHRRKDNVEHTQAIRNLDLEIPRLEANCKSFLAELEAFEKMDAIKEANLLGKISRLEAEKARLFDEAGNLAADLRDFQTIHLHSQATLFVVEQEGVLKARSTELSSAQSDLRQIKRSENEVRTDIQRVRQLIASMEEQFKHHDEHVRMQQETLDNLETQRDRSLEEKELLSSGLQDSKVQNESLKEEMDALKQRITPLFNGHAQDWIANEEATVAREVEKFIREVDLWKEKAENSRHKKHGETMEQHHKHDSTMQELQNQLASLQASLADFEKMIIRQKEETGALPLSPRTKVSIANRSSADAFAPGLVMARRPPPSHSMCRRKALLVGLNYPDGHAPLKGCVNDIWSFQCLLHHTLQYRPEEMRVLIDSPDEVAQTPDKLPTRDNILAGLRWLVDGAKPGDHLLFIFSGYGTQHPRSSTMYDMYEGYLVPSDFAADLPPTFFDNVAAKLKRAYAKETPQNPVDEDQAFQAAAIASRGATTNGYRLISLLEVQDFISRLPKMSRITLVLDCCYSLVPGIGPETNLPATFKKVKRGRVEYDKLKDFISRPRFLELPPLPVQHTPNHLPRSSSFPPCVVHVFSGCRLKEWCAEFPIEGTVQGAFSWAFVKALAQGHFHCGLYQFQRTLIALLENLKEQFAGVDQQMLLQISKAAAMEDVVLWT
eukprot:TRINITY_DN31520_c0_g1_i1.p1 TRINITY_DN31520_c0_g1~~TRINITY_DN31520_c0_g1_i1.p1  ORF type:complete len:1024 (+),score=218.99 TRINITY_DN31520_c0_g1_i1:147-3074(+)